MLGGQRGGVVRSRLAWALLVLAALFSMHGLNCVANEQAAGATTHGAMMAMGHDDSVPAGVGTAATSELDPASRLSSGMTATVVAGSVDYGFRIQETSGHGELMDMVTTCLTALACTIGAVLLGLAVRLARRRGRALSEHVRPAPRLAVGPSRPHVLVPEFSRLCVLRI